MALGRNLHIRICNQEIGVRDRYGGAPHLKAASGVEVVCVGGGGLGSIRKQLPHPDITFNLLMHQHKDVGPSICRPQRGKNRSFLHVSTPACPAPFQQHLRQIERRKPKSAYPPLVKELYLMSHFR